MPHELPTLTPYPFPHPHQRTVPAPALPVAPLTSCALGDDADRADHADDIFALARELGICSPTWLRTGCLHASQPGNLYSILVMPVPPDSTKRHNTYHATTTAVAPSLALYTAYRSSAFSWYDFALRYLAELDAKRHGALAQFVDHLCAIPAQYAGVLLLGFRQAPGGIESHVRCPRRLLRAWLLDEVECLPEMQRRRPLPLPLLSEPLSQPHAPPRPWLQAS